MARQKPRGDCPGCTGRSSDQALQAGPLSPPAQVSEATPPLEVTLSAGDSRPAAGCLRGHQPKASEGPALPPPLTA